MKKLAETVERLELRPEEGEDKDGCRVRLLTDARLEIGCCGRSTLVLDAPRGTRLWTLCDEERERTKVRLTTFAGVEVVEVGPGRDLVELPVRLAPDEFSLLFVALPNRAEVSGELRLTQRRGDRELSAGFSIVA
jgi:hypothetical protein